MSFLSSCKYKFLSFQKSYKSVISGYRVSVNILCLKLKAVILFYKDS